MDDVHSKLSTALTELSKARDAVYRGGTYEVNCANYARWMELQNKVAYLERFRDIIADIRAMDKEIDTITIDIVDTSSRCKALADSHSRLVSQGSPVKDIDYSQAALTRQQQALTNLNDRWLYLLTRLHETRKKLAEISGGST